MLVVVVHAIAIAPSLQITDSIASDRQTVTSIAPMSAAAKTPTPAPGQPKITSASRITGMANAVIAIT
jgi:hypothetical protein